MRTNNRLAAADAVGPDAEDSAPTDTRGKIRENLAVRYGWMDVHCSNALECLAGALALVHAELRGLTSILRGHNPERKWRSILLGEDPLSLADIFRLALSSRSEAHRAVDAILATLARVRGAIVVPVQRNARTAKLVEILGDAAREHGEFIGAGLSASSGGYTVDELDAIEQQLAEARGQYERASAWIFEERARIAMGGGRR